MTAEEIKKITLESRQRGILQSIEKAAKLGFDSVTKVLYPNEREWLIGLGYYVSDGSSCFKRISWSRK